MTTNDFQLFSFEISTEALRRDTYIELRDGTHVMAFPVRKNQTRHLYSNIMVKSRPEVRFDHHFDFTELSFGKNSFLPSEQLALNVNLKTAGSVTYKVVARGVPQRAVITFPQHRGFGGWLAPYSIFHGEKLAINDCLYISFQEPYLTSGSYFLVDNNGEDPVPEALKVIRRELHNHNLTEANATLIGSSKGANIAALVSQFLYGNQLILCNYSTELDYRLRNNFLNYLAQTFDRLNVRVPDMLNILSHEGREKDTHWLYTIGDDLANCGHEHLRRPRLKSYACTDPHGQVLRGNWEFIKSLIQGRFVR